MIRKANLLILFVIGLGFSTGPAERLDAGVIHGSVTLSGPFGKNGGDWGAQDDDEDGFRAIVENSGEFVGGSASGKAAAYINEIGEQVFRVSAKVQADEEPRNVQAIAKWADSFIIGGGPLPDYVDFTYFVSGSSSVSGQVATAFLSLSSYGGDRIRNSIERADTDPEQSGTDWPFPHDVKAITFPVSIRPFGFESQGSGAWWVEAWAYANAGLGTATADYAHTVTLTRITLPDGRTPEEAGYTLTFSSGLTSPNLLTRPSPVPEPSSLALLGMGVTGLCGYGWHRKRHLVG